MVQNNKTKTKNDSTHYNDVNNFILSNYINFIMISVSQRLWKYCEGNSLIKNTVKVFNRRCRFVKTLDKKNRGSEESE